MINNWTFRITAHHLIDNISTELYHDPTDCLWEIIRNGAVACMPLNKWAPERVNIELWLIQNHPLGNQQPTLVVIDHGSGLTDPDIKRFCSIGPSIPDARASRLKPRHSGAAQKRLGRFSAFALNRDCSEKHDVEAGFYIFTRTAPEGQVRFVPMIPSEIEDTQGVPVREIHPRSTELGNLRDVKGSFTAVVIPNCVFTNEQELAEAVKWRLPRRADLAFKTIKINDRPIAAPALASRVTVGTRGKIEAYLDRRPSEEKEGGIWLADAATSLRVAYAPRFGTYLPSPLWHQDLIGDIFAPNLLANQDTSRSGLKNTFLRSKEWKDVMLYLAGHVCEAAKTLLGNQLAFGREKVSQAARDFAELCSSVWGEPTTSRGGVEVVNEKPPSSSNGREKTGTGKNKGRKPSPTSAGRLRVLPFRIDGQTYLLSKRELDKWTLAQCEPNGEVISFNDEETYIALPTTKEARTEHVWLSILTAIATHLHPGDTKQIQVWVAEKRAQLLTARQ